MHIYPHTVRRVTSLHTGLETVFQTRQYHTDLTDALHTAHPKYKPLNDNEILTEVSINITLYCSVMLLHSVDQYQCFAGA